MTPEQCRGARAMLKWSQTRLGDETGLDLNVIYKFESGRKVDEFIVKLLQKRLKGVGIDFIGLTGINLRIR